MASTFRWFGIAAALVVASGCASNGPRVEPGARAKAVAVAVRMVGIPYRYGGSSPKGFDCSGLVYYSFGKAGYSVGRNTEALYDQSRWIKISQLAAGDLLFFSMEGKLSHVAIYVDDGRFIHAPSSGKKVSYGTLSNPYWRKHLIKTGRL